MTTISADNEKVADFEHRFRVALHDTDAAGVLFYAHLFRHAHDAYEGWMRLVGHPIDAIIREGTVGLPIAQAEASYRRPMRHGDEVCVRPGLADLWPHRFTIHYRFEQIAGALLATARTVHVCVDARTGRSHALPIKLAQTLQSLPRHGHASHR